MVIFPRLKILYRTSFRGFGSSDCLACGVSVFKSLSEMEIRRKRYLAWRGKKIAKGALDTNSGDTLQKGTKGYLTWWILIENPHLLFETV